MRKPSSLPFAILRRIAFGCAGGFLFLTAAGIGILTYPQPLFAYQVAQGRLELFSDRPFDLDKGRLILSDIERRLAASPLNDDKIYRIFVANENWHNRLVFLWNYGAGGVNYYPLRNVFIRAADINSDRVKTSSGTPIPPPRTFAYYGAHEIGHGLIGARVGPLANHRLPAWIREGVADYIAFGGDVDIGALTGRLRAGEAALDPKRSGHYVRYRLLVAYLLEREGWSIDQLLASKLPRAAAEEHLLAGTWDRR